MSQIGTSYLIIPLKATRDHDIKKIIWLRSIKDRRVRLSSVNTTPRSYSIECV